jgi:formamidopyrimidine-DNA glycosylase
MPELPEVEVTRQSFAERIRGGRIDEVRVGKPLRWPLGIEPERLLTQNVGDVTRRGKYLWVALDEGGLLMHLGMSGSLNFSDVPGPPGAHDHFDLVTSRGTLRLTDPRRFGAIVWSPGRDTGRAAVLLASLGLEPFDPALTSTYLHSKLRGRRVSIKQALLAGDIIVGCGNIYACEALFVAGIDPRVHADKVSRPRSEKLLVAIREILARAVELGGSSLRDFKNAHGVNGNFQQQAFVYGRAGLPCLVCATPIRRIVQGQRSTFFCPICQKR